MSSQSPDYLYGGSKSWLSQEWTSSDDRVRGGRSESHLSPSPSLTTALFHGNLDIKALGGAGFASQRTAGILNLDLSAYDGLALDVEKSDGKKYTLTIKDELLPRREDGREQSSISWEFDFVSVRDGETVFVGWADLKPTYRGRDKGNAEPLKRDRVQRISLMMRSFFGDQEGNFELSIRSIAAVKRSVTASKYRDDPDARRSMEGIEEKSTLRKPAMQGWFGWLIGGCIKL